MSVEHLYPLLTEAIQRAETLEDLRAPGARSAYLDVSLLEAKVAEELPASNPEGALARRGAVRAALSAGERSRAQQLAERFLAEAEGNAELQAELRELLAQAEFSAAIRDPKEVSKGTMVRALAWVSVVTVSGVMLAAIAGYAMLTNDREILLSILGVMKTAFWGGLAVLVLGKIFARFWPGTGRMYPYVSGSRVSAESRKPR